MSTPAPVYIPATPTTPGHFVPAAVPASALPKPPIAAAPNKGPVFVAATPEKPAHFVPAGQAVSLGMGAAPVRHTKHSKPFGDDPLLSDPEVLDGAAKLVQDRLKGLGLKVSGDLLVDLHAAMRA